MTDPAVRIAVFDAISALDLVRQRLVDLLGVVEGDDDGIQVPGQGRWTKEMVAQLWNAVRHLEGARALFEEAAAHPNDAITFEQVRTRSGLNDARQRNHHARITRIAADLFGQPRWPIQSWQSTPGPDGKAVMHYRMGAIIADWWRAHAAEPDTNASTTTAPDQGRRRRAAT